VFAGLINHAKAAASGLVLKYVARASVAVPFVIALGFALAAFTVMLAQRFGHLTAYWLVAGGFAAIGAVAAFAVSVKELEEEVAEERAEQADAKVVMATAQAMMQAAVGPAWRSLHDAWRRNNSAESGSHPRPEARRCCYWF
jgi:hypothetical protein